ncbi:Uncharacterised protein [Streptococcus pneumoniae]|nr:Uncharacterised protein [Streptococcus pneumoniae]
MQHGLFLQAAGQEKQRQHLLLSKEEMPQAAMQKAYQKCQGSPSQ